MNFNIIGKTNNQLTTGSLFESEGKVFMVVEDIECGDFAVIDLMTGCFVNVCDTDCDDDYYCDDDDKIMWSYGLENLNRNVLATFNDINILNQVNPGQYQIVNTLSN